MNGSTRSVSSTTAIYPIEHSTLIKGQRLETLTVLLAPSFLLHWVSSISPPLVLSPTSPVFLDTRLAFLVLVSCPGPPPTLGRVTVLVRLLTPMRPDLAPWCLRPFSSAVVTSHTRNSLYYLPTSDTGSSRNSNPITRSDITRRTCSNQGTELKTLT